MGYTNLRESLQAVFAWQVVAITTAVLIGAWLSMYIVESAMVRGTLQEEARRYEQRLAANPNEALPTTVLVRAYSEDNVPAPWVDLEPGYHKLELDGRSKLVWVEVGANGERRFFAFQETQFLELLRYYGLLPALLILIAIYGTALLGYRLAKNSVSPITELARRVRHADPRDMGDSEFGVAPGSDHEIEVLSESLAGLSDRIQELIARERAFTRDVSHELRTPLTVILMATDNLLADEAIDAYTRRNIERISSVAREMQSLIEALLVLARDQREDIPLKRFSVNEVVETEVERHRFMLRNKRAEMVLEHRAHYKIDAVPGVLAIVVGRFIQNACAYTSDGEVRVVVEPGILSVYASMQAAAEIAEEDRPLSEQSEALVVVRRLCQLFGWDMAIQTRIGEGTRVRLKFPEYFPVQDELPMAASSGVIPLRRR